MCGHRPEEKGREHTVVWGKGGDDFTWGVGQVTEGILTTQQEPQNVSGNPLWQAEVTIALVT